MFFDPEFYLVMKNTLAMSIFGLIFGFPLPIILAILINEIRHIAFKEQFKLCHVSHILSLE
jgi:putative aldouronate transport system permease protein